MKKRLSLYLAAFIFLFFIFNVYALDEELKVGNTLLDASYNNKTDILNEPIIVPEYLQSYTRFIFNLDEEEEISLSIFIVLFVLLAILFSIVQMSLSLTPSLEGNVKYVIAGCITLIASISGIMKNFAISLFSLSSKIKILSNYSIFGILFALIILLVVFFALRKLVNYIKGQYKIDDARKSAEDLIKEVLKEKSKD